jgi:hypothetical protein
MHYHVSVSNLDKRASRWARVAVFALVFVGLSIMLLVRSVMLKAGASEYSIISAVGIAIVLYSILANFVLAKKIGVYIRRIDAGNNRGIKSAAVRRGKLRILLRLLFQALLFCLGSWLLIGGSPDMGDLGRFPISLRLLIVVAALCLLIWRAISARRLVMQLDRQAGDVS